MSAALYCDGGQGEVRGCDISGPGLEARGLVLEHGAKVEVEKCSFEDTWGSAVWVRGGSMASLSSSSVRQPRTSSHD